MKIYLVGGAVRDQLLGLQVKEKDWVVVGSTPNEMRKNKFKQVGKDFPVFIHPKTGEEYALARTERKSGHGYTGFEFDTNPNVTLEEDLERRDLTINAIAQDEDGTLIDPFNGQEDIKNKKLRHVSDAFSEDPLRVLRVARFKANLDGFEIVEETKNKIKMIIGSGELKYLTGERIWLELYKANYPHIFAYNLDQLGASNVLPGYNEMIVRQIINNTEINPINHWVLSKFNLSKLQQISMFIHVCISDKDAFCTKLKAPNEYMDLAMMLGNCEEDYFNYEPKNGNHNQLISLIKKLDIRKEERLRDFSKIIEHIFSENDHISVKNKFMDDVILKIKSFKLNKNDQKKPNKEIQQIIEAAHKEIAKEHIKEYLNNKK